MSTVGQLANGNAVIVVRDVVVLWNDHSPPLDLKDFQLSFASTPSDSIGVVVGSTFGGKRMKFIFDG